MTKTKDIYLAGGCFWGTEHYFKQIEGVVETEVGFANGHTKNPTYKEVYTDTTGFVETVHVKYNPEVVSLEFLLQMFFKAIDPTSLNKQGHDEGTRYRTGIYYTESEDLPTIEKVYQEEQQHYQQPLAVEKLPLENFYTAEEYHQDYLDKNPTGYCHLPQSLFEFAKKAKDINKLTANIAQVETTELIRTSQSWNGAELPDYFQGRPEIVAMKYVIPQGQKLSDHHHDAMNCGILVQGELTIVSHDGTEKVVHEGEAIVEMVGTVHHGENRGTKPVILYMFYLSQEGLPLSVQHNTKDS